MTSAYWNGICYVIPDPVRDSSVVFTGLLASIGVLMVTNSVHGDTWVLQEKWFCGNQAENCDYQIFKYNIVISIVMQLKENNAKSYILKISQTMTSLACKKSNMINMKDVVLL